MPRAGRTREVCDAKARSRLSKAEEHLAAAQNELEAERGIAATSLEIHVDRMGGHMRELACG